MAGMYAVEIKTNAKINPKGTVEDWFTKATLPEGFTRNGNVITHTETGKIYIINIDGSIVSGTKPTGEMETSGEVELIVKGVPIPKGFSYLTGEKNTGLVIKNNTEGNEFVWVPVADVQGGLIQRQFRVDPIGTETLPEELKTSVNTYGGFYIARYEASYLDGKMASKPSTTATTVAWTNTNGRLWNYISQPEAVTKASEMYPVGGSHSVVSHLIYGAEWDTTLQWLIQSGNKTLDEIAVDSHSWGNYSSPLINTGSTGTYKANNIYDLAGNLWEWTQEKYSVTNCVKRGRCHRWG